ncbi:nucleotidyl transferase AbiEii/AbiGii toxin family protein [Nocardia sp. IFM 10818]
MTGSPWDRVVYDPLARQSAHRRRPTERPYFYDPARAEAWVAARREAMDCVLAAAVASTWSNNLVLRGSALLAARFGAWAREPADLDFVVTPRRLRADQSAVDRMLDEIASRAAGLALLDDSVRILAESDIAEIEPVWPYRGTAGRRLTLAWDCPRRGRGTVRVDFAFGEELPEPAREIRMPRLGRPGPPVVMAAATETASLAWKLMWLDEDVSSGNLAQGKDLFDAVLLAEHGEHPGGLFEAMTRLGGLVYDWSPPGSYDPETLADFGRRVDWSGFAVDYPLLVEAHEEFVQRFVAAVTRVY